MSGPTWDLIVVGAGPAGCAAAAAALGQRPDAAVLLLDRATFPRDKVCGDGIAAAALDQLAELGVGADALVEGYPKIDRLILTSPRGQVADRRAGTPSWVVPREVFDNRLRNAVLALGAVTEQAQIRRLTPTGDHVDLDGRFRARRVVVAAGVDSGLSSGRRRHSAMAIGLRGYARTELLDAQALSLSDAGWPAYAWSFPIGDGWANVGYGQLLSPNAAKVDRRTLLNRLERLTPGLSSAPGRLRAHRLPLAMRRPVLGSGAVLYAGDAAEQVNPLSGEGIFYAVRTGAAAGRAALTDDPLPNYRRSLRSATRHRRHAAALTAALRHTPALLEAGIAAAAADQRVFDELVALALADGTLTPRLLGRVASRLL